MCKCSSQFINLQKVICLFKTSTPSHFCACVPCYTSTFLLIYHISYSTSYLLLSQPGMKTARHLTAEINHPWPWTNYPSLPTRCPPLRGKLYNNSATWKSAAIQARALMDTPVQPPLQANLLVLVTLPTVLPQRRFLFRIRVRDLLKWNAQGTAAGSERDPRNHWLRYLWWYKL